MGWSFDVELLFIARWRGYRVIEIPIDWYYRPESKVNAPRDAVRMIQDIFQIHRNAWRGLMTRTDPDLAFEHKIWQSGLTYITGMDEAGRGALAGPVAVGAVILANSPRLSAILNGVRDLKQMSPLARQHFVRRIEEFALTWSVGFALSEEIDLFGIVSATRLGGFTRT